MENNREDKKSETDILKDAAYALKKMMDGEPKNINPLTEIPEPKMTLYGIESLFGRSRYYDTVVERDSYLSHDSFEKSVTIFYYGNFAGRVDVIGRKYDDSVSSYNKISGISYSTYLGDQYVGRYNHIRSFHRGEFVWEGDPGDLRDEYSAFKERGITLISDMYQKEDDRIKIITEMIENERKGKKVYGIDDKLRESLENILGIPFDLLSKLVPEDIAKLILFKLGEVEGTIEPVLEHGFYYISGDLINMVNRELEIITEPIGLVKAFKKIKAYNPNHTYKQLKE
jgi:hypothetical protein